MSITERFGAFTDAQLSLLRDDFPILNHVSENLPPLIYLDNAATTQKPRQVIEAMDRYYHEYNANVHRGIHRLSETATAAYEAARGTVKRFIGAHSRREIIFTSGTTSAINLVAHAWGRANLTPGDVVVLSVMEHHANIVPWQIIAEATGAILRFVPVLPDGSYDLEALRSLSAQEPVKLVGVTWVSNVLGTINPIAEISHLAHDAGALLLVDAAQAVPHLTIDVQANDIDFLAFSGHKILAPTGIGILYGKHKLLDEMPPFMGGGDMIASVTLDGSTWNELPYKFEAGTPPIAEAIGLAKAIDYLSAIGIDRIHAHEQALLAHAEAQLDDLPWVTLHSHRGAPRGGVLTFTIDGVHAHDVAQMLDSAGIAIRAGHHCAMPLHHHLGITASARASVYLYNTYAEIDAFVESLIATRARFENARSTISR